MQLQQCNPFCCFKITASKGASWSSHGVVNMMQKDAPNWNIVITKKREKKILIARKI